MRIALRTLALDRLAGEVIGDLERHQVPAILVKGASIAKWLYTDGVLRTYGDLDLLIEERKTGAAEERFRHLGFEPLPVVEFADKAPWVGRVWRRPDDLAAIDVHRTFQGVGVDPQTMWGVLSRRTSSLSVGGSEVKVLDHGARAFHLALHAIQHGAQKEKPIEDLRRGLALLPRSTWAEAAEVAHALDAVDYFSGGLRLLDEGRAVARELGLPEPRSMEALTKIEGAPELARGVGRFVELKGPRAKFGYLFRALVPTPASMRSGDPRTSGILDLAGAYIRRWKRVASAAPSVLSAYVKARRARKREPQGRTGNTG